MGARHREFGRMKRRRFVEGYHTQGLQAARTLHGLDDDVRALVGGLKTVSSQACDVQKDIRQAVIRNDESETLGDIEPFDSPAHLDDFERLLGSLGRGRRLAS